MRVTEGKRTPEPNLPAPALAAGALAGRFELLAELGSGSSGTVYRARLTQAFAGQPKGTEVAIKFLRQDRLHDEKARERFLAEGALGKQVQHRCVAAIYAIETMELLGLQFTYLVMELVQGKTLRAYLEEQGPPVEDLTRRIGADAASGLAALHRRSVVHRDVKPENLVLTPAGEVKIVDLGLARPFGAIGMGTASSYGHGIGGTVAYAAPESLRGKPASPRSDLYALGVVLYEVATGRHPFAHCTTPDDMIHAHLMEAPARPSHLRPRISALLEQLLLELLQKDPELRPRDANEVARILQTGEPSDWWRKYEQRAPALASARRLQRMRRTADTAFFGRKQELDQLDTLLALARKSQGQILCITGPEGIGRRRLLDEAMARWLDAKRDVLFLGGEAGSGIDRGEPFASAVLDWLLRGDSVDAPHAAARAEARARTELQLGDGDAKALVAVATGSSQEPPEVRASRLVTALLATARKDRVLVLRVDLADRLDTSGRLVLQRLAQECRTRPLLLLLTAGADGLPQLPNVPRIDLHGLDETTFAEFGRALFRDGNVPDTVLASAHTSFSGSPGNLIEALEHLAQQEQLRGRPGEFRGLDPSAELRPAPRHLARLEQRVVKLDPVQRRVLAAAAVLGLRCTLSDLTTLADAKELAVLETLSLFRGRVVRAQGGEVAFRHRDFQMALLRLLQPDERAALHCRAAALLAERGRPPLEVGMQYSQALDHRAAIGPLLLGLEQLVRSGSRRTSQRIAARLRVHFQHFQQLPPEPEIERARLRYLLLWARSRTDLHQHDQATALLREAEALAINVGDPVELGAARTGLAAVVLDRGELGAAIEWLDQAHANLDARAQAPDAMRARSIAAEAHALHSRTLLYQGKPADGIPHVQAALRFLPAESIDLRCHYEIDLARLEALLHNYPGALKILARVESEKQAQHLPRVRIRLHLYRGYIRTMIGDDDGAQDLRACAQMAESLSLPVYGSRAHVFLGERAFFQKRDEEAREEFLRARELASGGVDHLGGALAAIWLYRLGSEPLGDLPERIPAFGLPELSTALLLSRCQRARADGEELAAARHGEAALECAQRTMLPLPQHLRALSQAGREVTARSLVRTIAERMPDRRSRKRFLSLWERGARL